MKKVSERIVIDNGYRKCIERCYENPDTGNISNWLVLSDSGIQESIGVLARRRDGRFILIREYRVGPEQHILECILGGGEPDISHVDNARKELEEEAGYTAGKIIEIGTLINGPYYTGKMHIYFADDCVESGYPDLEEEEDIQVMILSQEELESKIHSSDIVCPYTISLYFLAKARTNNFTNF